MKSKVERESYIQLNTEFHRIAKRDKEAFLNEHCKEVEKNNRMGKTRDLVKKMKRSREHFKQRWYNKGQKWQGQQKQKKLRSGGKNTQTNYTKNVLLIWITMMVWTLTQSQIPWNVKLSGPRKHYYKHIPAELFQILKDDAVKVLH